MLTIYLKEMESLYIYKALGWRQIGYESLFSWFIVTVQLNKMAHQI